MTLPLNISSTSTTTTQTVSKSILNWETLKTDRVLQAEIGLILLLQCCICIAFIVCCRKVRAQRRTKERLYTASIQAHDLEIEDSVNHMSYGHNEPHVIEDPLVQNTANKKQSIKLTMVDHDSEDKGNPESNPNRSVTDSVKEEQPVKTKRKRKENESNANDDDIPPPPPPLDDAAFEHKKDEESEDSLDFLQHQFLSDEINDDEDELIGNAGTAGGPTPLGPTPSGPPE
eukprot:53361_1